MKLLFTKPIPPNPAPSKIIPIISETLYIYLIGFHFAVVGHGFRLGMFECADAAFLIGAYPSSQVGSGDAVVVCGTLLAAYVQVVEYGLVFEV